MDDFVQIRKAELADSLSIAELLASLGYPGGEHSIEHKVRQQISHPDARLLVAVAQERVIGFVSLHFIPQLGVEGDFCRISYFCVSAASRCRGVGAALEEQAAALAAQRGCDRIELHCHARREAAHRFYHRQGYVESPKYLVKAVQAL